MLVFVFTFISSVFSAVAQQLTVEYQVHHIHGHLHGERGNTYGKHTEHQAPLQLHRPELKPQRSQPGVEVAHHPDEGDCLGNDCSPGRPLDTPVEHEDEYRVQDSIQQSAQKLGEHGGAGMPVGADEVVYSWAHGRKYTAVHKDAEIPLGIWQKIRCSPYGS